MIRTHCPICHTPFDVSSGLVGQKGLCANCGGKFIITAPDQGNPAADGRTTQPMSSDPTVTSPPRATASAWPGIILATLIALVTAATFYWLKTATLPASLDRWVNFIGLSHPLCVHFPVAWITGIFVLGIVGGERNNFAIRILLWLNLLTCAAAIIAGQCSALDRGEGVILTRHLYAGLAVAGFSWLSLCFFLKREATPDADPWPYRISIVGAVGSVVLAGHLGANLTHGEILDHLPWKAPAVAGKEGDPQNQAIVPPTAVEDVTVLQAVILPIMEARCVTCHGTEKQKGDLRLDSYEAMMAAGESGKHSFVAANPAQSESLNRILLPADHDDHMPPAKKPQVEPAELEVLQWWVLAGADPKLKLAEAPAPEGVKTKLQELAKNPPKITAVTP
jgi:hypothetical protein